MKKLITFGHQGDLNFRKINTLPSDLKKMKYDNVRGGYTLALGEHTNHAHTVTIERGSNKVNIWIDKEGRAVLEVKEEVTLWHGTFVAPAKINEQEIDKHKAITFAPGIYQTDFEEDYDPFMQQIKRVID